MLSSSSIAKLRGLQLLSAEFLYRPAPMNAERRAVFEYALHSRLRELSRYDQAGVLWVANDPRTANDLYLFERSYPNLHYFTIVTVVGEVASPTDSDSQTPQRCEWQRPERWHLMQYTDRWVRIRAALKSTLDGAVDYLLMPAWDAVWGRNLLNMLLQTSYRRAVGRYPAAVSPHTFWQHSSVPSAPAPESIVRATNAAFNRDADWRRKLVRGEVQGLWGKMSLIPLPAARLLYELCEMRVWEDDREMDSVLQKHHYPVVARWVQRPQLYRQALPVFSENDLLAVLERHLHYTLDIPGVFSAGQTLLQHPLREYDLWMRHVDMRWREAIATSERLIAEAVRRVQGRLERFGCSWVDWGDYRLVAAPGNPFVQVWKSTADWV